VPSIPSPYYAGCPPVMKLLAGPGLANAYDLLRLISPSPTFSNLRVLSSTSIGFVPFITSTYYPTFYCIGRARPSTLRYAPIRNGSQSWATAGVNDVKLTCTIKSFGHGLTVVGSSVRDWLECATSRRLDTPLWGTPIALAPTSNSRGTVRRRYYTKDYHS
jgi:hypothetical protein